MMQSRLAILFYSLLFLVVGASLVQSHASHAITATLTPAAWMPVIKKSGDMMPTPCSSPTIEFTFTPPISSTLDLQGRVTCVNPTDYKVAVYIYVSGWWNKPTWASSLTSIRPDGTWTTDITTGGVDEQATQIAAFLVRNSYAPPQRSGEQVLPAELYSNAVAYLIVERKPTRTIQFSGYTWKVKSSVFPVGPGPNNFSASPDDVWVDSDGRLHLRIAYRNGKWYATEVINNQSLGYGAYTFTLSSRVDLLNKNVVLGLFTWDDAAPQHNYREIDIEFARWGEDAGQNAQYVVQPWTRAGNRHRFGMALTGNASTHRFIWKPSQIQFDSWQGRNAPPGPADAIESWTYTGSDIPPAGGENARINLWLLDGKPPSDGQEVEVVIESFVFVP